MTADSWLCRTSMLETCNSSTGQNCPHFTAEATLAKGAELPVQDHAAGELGTPAHWAP